MADTDEVKSRIEFESNEATETEETEVEVEESTETEVETETETPEVEESEDPVFTFGDEAAPASQEQDNSVIRELRAQNRELARKLKETAQTEAKAETPKLPEKPTLESCDYDEEEFERKVTAYYEAKRQVEAAEKAKEDELKQQQEAQQQRLQAYQSRAAELKVKDFKDVEEEVASVLSVAQQAILFGADDTAALVYTLGKHPEKLKELASIKDPAKFAFAAAKLETQMKVTTRKPKVSPEGQVAPGSGSLQGGADQTLERLRAEAEKTGDYSKVGKYRRQMQQAK